MSPKPPPSNEITPEPQYLRRRELIKNAALAAGTAAVVGGPLYWLSAGRRAVEPAEVALVTGATGAGTPLEIAKRGEYTVAGEALTPRRDVTTYNNFYELGLDKGDPALKASTLKPRPWSVQLGGLVKTPRTVDIDELLSWFALEERVYRFRCVEAWSMVIPWLGFPLRALIDRLEPLSSAKYVAFTTLLDAEALPMQKTHVLDWPYVEGLRIDEATHPLTLLAVGLYGKALPPQNGAPLRLVVPWKYGFKSIKSIVKIELTETPPRTTWNVAAPSEYGFYANVNPAVPHPRWSQATERRIGELKRRPTLPFNGYADEVASLYRGLDPKTLY